MHRILLYKTSNQKTKKIEIMKASIIYTVAVSVVLLSSLDFRLNINSLDSIEDKNEVKTNQIDKRKVSSISMAKFVSKASKTCSFVIKKEKELKIVKPELVLEENPFSISFSTNKVNINFEYDVIEDTDKNVTQALNFNWINTISLDEVVELPINNNIVGSSDFDFHQELAIIEERKSNDLKTLDFKWIETLSMFDETIVWPKTENTSDSFDFSVVGEEDAILEQPLDFKWIEMLQMFDEPIITPVQ